MLNKSMNYKIWILSGLLLVGIVGGNDIYNYFVHQEQFVEMGKLLRMFKTRNLPKASEIG